MLILTASQDKWLFDGETFVKIISLANVADKHKWQEVTNEEKERWEQEHNPLPEAPEV